MTKREIQNDCLFCQRDHTHFNFIAETENYTSFYDQNPVTSGHAFVIPKGHILSFFDQTPDEIAEMYELLKQVKLIIQTQHNPDGYNIGVNDGIAAGRTIHHLHIHLIPRYNGDVEEPRGGVRHIIPGKGLY